jgi:hypothetical protein
MRTSINSFYPYGWVPMNDGSIGNASSNADTRANVDTWQLFNLIWTIGKPFDSGALSNPVALMVTSTGSLANYGSSAIADFNANRRISLTKSMGLVMMGTAPASSLGIGTTVAFKNTFTASSSSGLLITTPTDFYVFQGMPVYVSNVGGSLPGNLAPNTIYYVTNITGTNTFHLATTYANAIARTAIAFSSAGTGTNTITSMYQGVMTGEYSHVQTVAELANHGHTGVVALSNNGASGTATPGAAFQLTTSSTNLSINNTGGSLGSNLVQLGVFSNIFAKL